MRIFVKVKPNAREEKIEKISDNKFFICTKEPPTDGKANKAVIKILSNYFGIQQSKIKIISGLSSKQKYIEIL